MLDTQPMRHAGQDALVGLVRNEPVDGGKLDPGVDRRGAHGHVVTVSINNPARLNSLSSGVIAAFIEAVREAATDPDLRCLIVTGEGERSFIGGANLLELEALNPETARAFLTQIHTMCRVLRDLPVPVIARVNGFCLGAGLEVMAACDMHVASDNAVFGMPEVKIGLPSVVEAALLPQLIGWGRTKVLLYTGDNINAATALDWGLVERVVPLAKLDSAVEEWVAAIVESGPRAIRLQKELIREWEAMPISDAIQAGIRMMGRAYETDEPHRMVGAARARLRDRKK
jgi:enoyl-CoA hydratase/carnithine racemase